MLRRILATVAGLLVVLAVAGAVLLWRCTHTPYGRMDAGAALIAHTTPGLDEITPEARARGNAWVARFRGEPLPSVAIRDVAFSGPAGELPLRLYTPSGRGPFPVVVWIHGGGFFMGDELPSWDGTCSELADAAGVLVASVGYRLAPEHPFPAAAADSYAALLHVVDHAAEWQGDAGRLAVMGGSAGGNLAAVVAQRARDEGGPRIAYQVLVVPGLQASGEPTQSRRIFAEGYGLDGVEKMVAAYLPNPADHANPRASPILAADFAGLPPALILTAEFDPLRDEGEAYGERLRAAGVPATVRRFEGAIHGFLGSPDDARAADALIAQTLRQVFAASKGG